MSLKKFYDELGRGLPHPTYLLYAEDSYHLKEALFSVKDTVPEGQRDFLLSVFDLDSPDNTPPVQQIVDVLYTIPFMGGRKTVVIENVQKLLKADAEHLGQYIAKPSPDSVLLMLNAGTLKKTISAALQGAQAIPMDIREREMPAWLSAKAREKGIQLMPDAIEYLIGAVGPEAGLLSSELEKIAVTGLKRVSAEEIAEIVRGSGGYDAFDLVNALKAKDADRVFKIYRTLAETQDAYGLVGVLNWHYGRASAKWKNREKVFGILKEADLMLKSTGGVYPVEYLLFKLLRL